HGENALEHVVVEPGENRDGTQPAQSIGTHRSFISRSRPARARRRRAQPLQLGARLSDEIHIVRVDPFTGMGQEVEINDPIATFTGENGSFRPPFRIGWLNAGRGYTVGTSTWKFVRGTGAYRSLSEAAEVPRSGLRPATLPPEHPVSFRAHGYLRPR